MLSNSERDALNYVLDRFQDDYKFFFKSRNSTAVKYHYINRRPYSIVAKVSLSVSDNKKIIYIKLPFSGKSTNLVKKEFEVLKYYREKFSIHPRYGVVTPLAYYDDPAALITEETSGKPLNEVLRDSLKIANLTKNHKNIKNLCRKCGIWLKLFHDILPFRNDNNYSINDEIEFIRDQLFRCLEKGLIKKEISHVIFRYLDISAESISGFITDLAGMHSDFIPSNIIVAENRVHVLDFSSFKTGPKCRDLLTFLYALDGFLNNPMYRRNMISALKNEFLIGYEWDQDNENISILNLFQIREILGRLLQLSNRVHRKFFRTCMFSILKSRSEKELISVTNQLKRTGGFAYNNI